jgi:hypothetical protein
MGAVNGILATKTIENIPHCIVNEALRIGWIQFRKRDNGRARLCCGVDRG